jgi:hypothetical protein
VRQGAVPSDLGFATRSVLPISTVVMNDGNLLMNRRNGEE